MWLAPHARNPALAVLAAALLTFPATTLAAAPDPSAFLGPAVPDLAELTGCSGPHGVAATAPVPDLVGFNRALENARLEVVSRTGAALGVPVVTLPGVNDADARAAVAGLDEADDRALAFLALTAPREGVHPADYVAPLGAAWFGKTTARVHALSADLAAAEAAGETFSNGWPTDATIRATSALREARLDLALAALYLGYHDTNYDGNLAAAFPDLATLAAVAYFDALALATLDCALTASVLDETTVLLANGITIIEVHHLNNRNGLVPYLVAVVNGAWYSTAAPAALAGLNAFVGAAGPAETLVRANVASALQGNSAPQRLYHGGYVTGYEVIGNTFRALPADAGAVTDGPAETAWSVAVGGFGGSTTYAGPAFYASSDDAALAHYLAPNFAATGGVAVSPSIELLDFAAAVNRASGGPAARALFLDDARFEDAFDKQQPFAPVVENTRRALLESTRWDTPERDDIIRVRSDTPLLDGLDRDGGKSPLATAKEFLYADRGPLIETEERGDALEELRRWMRGPVYEDNLDPNVDTGVINDVLRYDPGIDVNRLVDRTLKSLYYEGGDDSVLDELALKNNVGADLAETPTVYREDGRIWQATWRGFTLLVQEEREPQWIEQGGQQNAGECVAHNIGTSFTAAGAVVAAGGGAAMMTGAGAPLGAAAVAVGGASVAIGTVINAFTDDDACDAPPPVYDPGLYHEAGVFTDYYGNFGWLGNGDSVLGGLVRVYGTTVQKAAVNWIKEYPYDNAGDDTGWAHGKQSAYAARSAADEASDVALEEFHDVASADGGAWLTIELLCAGLAAVTWQSNFDLPVIDDGRTSVCLRIVIGSDDVGALASEGYGTVTHASEGVDGTGYVRVNGNAYPSPAVVDAEGSGINCVGGVC